MSPFQRRRIRGINLSQGEVLKRRFYTLACEWNKGEDLTAVLRVAAPLISNYCLQLSFISLHTAQEFHQEWSKTVNWNFSTIRERMEGQ